MNTHALSSVTAPILLRHPLKSSPMCTFANGWFTSAVHNFKNLQRLDATVRVTRRPGSRYFFDPTDTVRTFSGVASGQWSSKPLSVFWYLTSWRPMGFADLIASGP